MKRRLRTPEELEQLSRDGEAWFKSAEGQAELAAQRERAEAAAAPFLASRRIKDERILRQPADAARRRKP